MSYLHVLPVSLPVREAIKDINKWTISVKFFIQYYSFNQVKNFQHVHKLGTSRTMFTSSTCTLKQKIDVVHHNYNK